MWHKSFLFIFWTLKLGKTLYAFTTRLSTFTHTSNVFSNTTPLKLLSSALSRNSALRVSILSLECSLVWWLVSLKTLKFLSGSDNDNYRTSTTPLIRTCQHTKFLGYFHFANQSFLSFIFHFVDDDIFRHFHFCCCYVSTQSFPQPIQFLRSKFRRSSSTRH